MAKNRFTTLLVLIALFVAGSSVAHAEQGLVTRKALSIDMAMAMAQASLAKCRSINVKCAITVLDASGRTMIAIEEDGSQLYRAEVAHKKAYTALIYRRPSRETVEAWSKKMSENIPLQEGTIPSPPVDGTIAMGGGLPITAGNEVIGAIAVSGAPGWPGDEAAAKAGIDKVADKLK